MIANILLFLFLTPAIIYTAFAEGPMTKSSRGWIIAIGMILSFLFFSFRFFYRGIEIDEGHTFRYRGRAGRISEGDKEFFSLMSKPFAFIMQLMVLFIHAVIFKDIYWIVLFPNQ